MSPATVVNQITLSTRPVFSVFYLIQHIIYLLRCWDDGKDCKQGWVICWIVERDVETSQALCIVAGRGRACTRFFLCNRRNPVSYQLLTNKTSRAWRVIDLLIFSQLSVTWLHSQCDTASRADDVSAYQLLQHTPGSVLRCWMHGMEVKGSWHTETFIYNLLLVSCFRFFHTQQQSEYSRWCVVGFFFFHRSSKW